MSSELSFIQQMMAHITLSSGLSAFLVLAVGIVAARLISGIVGTVVGSRLNRHTGMIAQKLINYVLVFTVGIYALSSLGIDPTGLIAVTGVVGIALALAAQKSVSNIISGIFLLTEKPFEVEDMVEIEGVYGIIADISLLSTRIRTFDNTYVRIPNETVVSTKIINYSRYPIRRMKIDVGIAYEEDVAKAKQVLLDVANAHEDVLAEPKPMVVVDELADSSVNLRLLAWTTSKDWYLVNSDMIEGVKKGLDEAGIKIPFPQRTLHIVKEPKKGKAK